MSERQTRDPSRRAGEDLSEGPTPETRHPDGGFDDVQDTTQGPTPEARHAERAGDSDSSASGQPSSDPRTRGERAGNQDQVDEGTDHRSDDGGSIVRSEEELAIGTRREQTGQATMRKTVETEQVTQTVPVEHEQARITREPIAPGEGNGAPIGEQTIEVDLEEEVVEVDKRVVPKERMRLERDVETEQRTLEAQLLKERVEVEHDGDLEERR